MEAKNVMEVKNVMNKSVNEKQLNVKPSDLKSLYCEHCQGELFSEGIMIKTVSALLTTTGKEGMMQIPALYCVTCRRVVEKYLPEDMRKPKIS